GQYSGNEGKTSATGRHGPGDSEGIVEARDRPRALIASHGFKRANSKPRPWWDVVHSGHKNHPTGSPVGSVSETLFDARTICGDRSSDRPENIPRRLSISTFRPCPSYRS